MEVQRVIIENSSVITVEYVLRPVATWINVIKPHQSLASNVAPISNV